MAVLDTTAYTNALNRLYPKGLDYELFEQGGQSTFVAWIPKKYADSGGLNWSLRPMISGINGSANFTTARNNRSTPTIKDYSITRVKNYVHGLVDNETLEASIGTKNASAEALKTQIDAARYEFARSLAHQAWGNGGGARGQISTGSTVTTDTITLADTRATINFEVGMKLQSDTTDGTSGAVNSGTVEIESIDADAGTITVVESSWDTGIPSVATSDYLFREGDFGACLKGVGQAGTAGWAPVSVPTSGDSHFGVDRSVHPVRLAGSRVTVSGSVVEGIFDAQARLDINGGRADSLWLHTERWADLCKDLQAKVDYSPGGNGQIGFASFTVAGPRGMVKVYADRNCSYRYGLLTRRGAWELRGLGKFPRFSKLSGGAIFRESETADALEFRLKGYMQMLCLHTLDNCRLDFGA